MDILQERPSDAAGIRTVVEAAFPTPAEAQLVEALRASGDAVVSAIAVEQGAIVGHAMLSKMTGPFAAVGLAPVSVLPSRQRQSIGSRLVRFALEQARVEGWAAVFVLGDPAFYERFGFSLALAEGFRSPYSGPHFMALALRGDLPTDTGVVGYALAFAEL